MPINNELPADVERSINTFVEAAKAAFETDLVSVLMFGSAAEGRLRATSDVNMLLVLKAFDQTRADRLREPLRIAHAAVQLNAMFLMENEVAANGPVTFFPIKRTVILSDANDNADRDPARR